MTKAAPTTPAEVQTKEPSVPVVHKRTRPLAKDIKQTSNLNEPLVTGPNYTLESQNLLVELGRLKDNANAEILSIMAEQNSIHERAQRDMETIRNRAQAEITARQLRIRDLKQSINLIDNGLSAPKPEEEPTSPDGFSPPVDESENEQ